MCRLWRGLDGDAVAKQGEAARAFQGAAACASGARARARRRGRRLLRDVPEGRRGGDLTRPPDGGLGLRRDLPRSNNCVSQWTEDRCSPAERVARACLYAPARRQDAPGERRLPYRLDPPKKMIHDHSMDGHGSMDLGGSRHFEEDVYPLEQRAATLWY